MLSSASEDAGWLSSPAFSEDAGRLSPPAFSDGSGWLPGTASGTPLS